MLDRGPLVLLFMQRDARRINMFNSSKKQRAQLAAQDAVIGLGHKTHTRCMHTRTFARTHTVSLALLWFQQPLQQVPGNAHCVPRRLEKVDDKLQAATKAVAAAATEASLAGDTTGSPL